MTELRQMAINGFKVGQRFSIIRRFTHDDILKFGKISRDYNPVHYDDRFAISKGFNGRICHGLMVASLITEIGGQLGLLAVSMDFSFKRPVYIGDEITCHCTFMDIYANGKALIKAEYINQHGDLVLECNSIGIPPSDGDRAVMMTMLKEGDPTNTLDQKSSMKP